MKNIFFVINKEKIYAYIVSIFTIITLLFLSQVLNSDLLEVEETTTNIEQNTNTENNVIVNNITMENNSKT